MISSSENVLENESLSGKIEMFPEHVYLPQCVMKILSWIDFRVLESNEVANDLLGFGCFKGDPQREIWFLFPTVVFDGRLYKYKKGDPSSLSNMYLVYWRYVKKLIFLNPFHINEVVKIISKNMKEICLLKDLELTGCEIPDLTVLELIPSNKLLRLHLKAVKVKEEKFFTPNFAPNLKILELQGEKDWNSSFHPLHDKFFEESKMFPKLEVLELRDRSRIYGGAKITGSTLSVFKNLKKLSYDCKKFDWKVLSKFESLEELEVKGSSDTCSSDRNGLDASKWIFPKTLKKLSFYDLEKIRGTFKNVPISSFSKLESVRFLGNNRTKRTYHQTDDDTIIDFFHPSPKTNLEELVFTNMGDSESPYDVLRRYDVSKLKSLTFRLLHGEDKQEKKESEETKRKKIIMPELKELSLLNPIDDAGYISHGYIDYTKFKLKKLHLHYYNFRHCESEDQTEFKKRESAWVDLISHHAKTLEELILDLLILISDEKFGILVFEKLRKLRIHNNKSPNLTGKGWNETITKNLEEFTLDYGGVMGDPLFIHNEFPNLKKLTLISCHAIKGEKWNQKMTDSLTKLSIEHCHELNDTLFQQHQFANLRSLYLVTAPQVRGTGWKIYPKKVNEFFVTSDRPFPSIENSPLLETLFPAIDNLEEVSKERLPQKCHFFKFFKEVDEDAVEDNTISRYSVGMRMIDSIDITEYTSLLLLDFQNLCCEIYEMKRELWRIGQSDWEVEYNRRTPRCRITRISSMRGEMKKILIECVVGKYEGNIEYGGKTRQREGERLLFVIEFRHFHSMRLVFARKIDENVTPKSGYPSKRVYDRDEKIFEEEKAILGTEIIFTRSENGFEQNVFKESIQNEKMMELLGRLEKNELL